MKFTFKKDPRETGLAGVAQGSRGSDIKLKGKVIGHIYGPSRYGVERTWYVGLMIKRTPTELWPSPFAWQRLIGRFSSDQAAREYLQRNAANILTFDLYHSES